MIDRDFPESSGKKPCRSEDDLPLALKETSSLVERDLQPWGGSNPPFKKPLLASSEHLSFHYNKDAPFASDPDSCAELVRRIRGGMCMMPEISEFAFPDGFRESARADIEVNSFQPMSNVLLKLKLEKFLYVIPSQSISIVFFPFFFLLSHRSSSFSL